MTRTDICFVCRRGDSQENLGVWLVGDAVRPVHLECWLASYDPRSATGESGDAGARDPWEREGDQAS
jgi:hypothetical protein